ncbi:tail fiber hinge [Yersinia phage JC221]|nr:tail fiber hinge [Yersinia phage JC221]
MGNNQLMARFGPDSVTASVFSEANSTKYKLCVRGSNGDSRINEVEVSINDVDVINRSTQKGRGLNLAVIDAATSTLVEWKYYDTYASNRDTAVAAFKTYITNLPITRIVAIYSFDAMLSTAELDTFMADYMGSVAWPGSAILNVSAVTNVSTPARASYCAIYNSKLRKIVVENSVGNSHSSLNEDTRSFAEIVYDELDDIGANGIPARMIDDPTERTGNGSAYKAYEWSEKMTIGVDANISDIISLTADLFQDQTLTNAGGYACISVYAANASGSIIGEKRIDSRTGTVGKYSKQTDYFTIPSGAVTIGCTFYHFPSTVKTGTSKVKNVIVTKVSRIPKVTTDAAIGVNGIRMTQMREQGANGTDNPIAKLLILPVNTSSIADSGRFAEMDTIVSDSTQYQSTVSSVYDLKVWANTVKLASVNAKVGDKIVFNAELARDSGAVTNGKYTSLIVAFLNSAGKVISTGSIDASSLSANTYVFLKDEVIIPANTDSIIIKAVRGPENITTTGNCMIRNTLVRIDRGA